MSRGTLPPFSVPWKKVMRLFLRRAVWLMAVILAGGLLGATLVRYAPGYGVDERELDPRLSQASVEALRVQHHPNANLLGYYAKYLTNAVRGDLGISESTQRPVSELIHERFPVTAKAVLLGMLSAWSLAFFLAMLGQYFRGWVFEVSSTLLTGFLLALPSTVIALLFVYFRAPVYLAIACVTFPKLFRFIHNLLVQAYEQPHVLAARARGIGPVRIFLRHVLAFASPALFALLGVSLSLAFGAAIPIEALTDSPGIGQLAWFAAINRDLPLVVNLTLLVTLITVAGNSLADYSGHLATRAS
ncbi:MAG: ABC transporter permease [Candidatus Acidiferrum sp.]